MGVPSSGQIREIVLDCLKDGAVLSKSELALRVGDALHLSEADRALTKADGEPLIESRVWHAADSMVKAGLLERDHGRHKITNDGRVELRDGCPLLRGLRPASGRPSPVVLGGSLAEVSAALSRDSSPLETAEDAARDHATLLENELLELVRTIDPTAFERLVLQLLGAMGYGGSGSLEHSGRSGDGGIDGVISLDPLGLDRVYVQAKRYAAGNTVGRPDLQGFVGALRGLGADRGVFITTSAFTREAQEWVPSSGARIALVDGIQLARLLAEHDVGVQTAATFILKKVDQDFFDSL